MIVQIEVVLDLINSTFSFLVLEVKEPKHSFTQELLIGIHYQTVLKKQRVKICLRGGSQSDIFGHFDINAFLKGLYDTFIKGP